MVVLMMKFFFLFDIMKKLIKECMDKKKKLKVSQFVLIKVICNEENLCIFNDFVELCVGVV